MTSPSEPTDEEVQIQNLTSPRAALSSLRPVEPEPEAPVSATGDTAPALLVYSRRGSCAPAPAVEVDDPATPLPCLPSPKDLFLSKVVKAVGTVLPAPKINKRRTKNPPPDSTPPPPRRSRRKAGLDPEVIQPAQAKARKGVMRSLGLDAPHVHLQQQELEDYARLFQHPLSDYQINALASLFGLAPPVEE